MSTRLIATVFAMAALSIAGVATATANTFTLLDNYDGGLDTYNSGGVIGTQTFQITSAVVYRTNNNNTLNIIINTWFAGAPSAGLADGTGYGSLFLSPGAWSPNGTAPYTSDMYTNSNHSQITTSGEWQYAVTMPLNPGTLTGTSGLYSTGTLLTANAYSPNPSVVQSYTTTTGQIFMSNVNGDPVTYPGSNNPEYYFRQGQAVQFSPGSTNSLANWTITPSTVINGNYITEGSIDFVINDNDALGNTFALAWAMTCANGAIQGQVNLTPIPAALPLFASGLGFLGFVGLRRRKRTIEPALKSV